MRGDNQTGKVTLGRNTSVHPHMRGDNRTIDDYVRDAVRFTPTCVGTTCSALVKGRGCSGSPPHAWGQLQLGMC